MKYVREMNKQVLDPKKCKLSDTIFGVYGRWKHGTSIGRLFKVVEWDGFHMTTLQGHRWSGAYKTIALLNDYCKDNIELIVPETLDEMNELLTKHSLWAAMP